VEQVQKQSLSLLSNLASFYSLDRAFKAAPRLEDAVVAAVALHASVPEVPRRAALVILQLARSPPALARLRAAPHPQSPLPAAAGRVPPGQGRLAEEDGAGRALLRAAVEVARDSPHRRDVVEALFRALAAVVRELRIDGARVALTRPDDVRAAAAAVDREARLESGTRVILGPGAGKASRQLVILE
jgi:hypothetical protein